MNLKWKNLGARMIGGVWRLCFGTGQRGRKNILFENKNPFFDKQNTVEDSYLFKSSSGLAVFVNTHTK
ncbi:hypothetical protein [Leptospira interrogans]|uniref:hypothetical protein n=1 Tax=Leptospira interrogans TaxID=173 RepID=UPI0003624E20|nr:hypothetical protein [Leptospira interrogans]